MKIFKIKSKAFIGVVALCVFSFGIIVSAASKSYTVTLPAFQGIKSFSSGTKTSSTSYITNSISSIGGDYDAVNCWVTDSSDTSVSDDVYTCYEGQGTYTINLDNTYGKGKLLYLKGNNESFTYVNVTCKGTVDFN